MSALSKQRDEGSSLILALVLILVGSMMVLPVMKYTMTVTRTNRVSSDKADRVEAVKAGLRVALYDPLALYKACTNSGPGTSLAIAAPPVLNIASRCNTMSVKQQDVPTEQRYALSLIQAGATMPPTYVATPSDDPLLNGTVSPTWCTSMNTTPQVPCGKPYPGNGNANITAWMPNSSTTMQKDKIFAPPLPPFSNSLKYAAGYDMPAAEGPCTVYFPGKYLDPILITGPTPVYFASGVYYFENTVRFTDNANVVVGTGAAPGCVESDAVAVADAINAPFDANSNGVGGTFVFGANGRLVIDTATSSNSDEMHVTFNRRLVDQSDPLAALNNISIMSVNGVWNSGTQVTSDLDIPGQLHVPVSPVLNGATTVPDPWTHTYKASNLVSTATAPVSCAGSTPFTTACPIIDINLDTNGIVDVKVTGYVAIPQGSMSVYVKNPGKAKDKTVSLAGGVLAAQIVVSNPAPEFFQMGLLNPVVQKTFKITTDTITGTPKMSSIALVQINETGGYAVNSWVVVQI